MTKTWTVKALADYYRVAQESILTHIREGRIQAFNIGHGKQRPRWRISDEARKQFEKSQAVGQFEKSQAVGQPQKKHRRRKKPDNVIEFY